MSKTNVTASHRKRFTTLLSVILLLGSVVLVGGARFPALGATSSLNNVQVFVNTAAQYQYSFYYSAYNLSGSLVASSESPYPAGGFELPSGSYLFTVSAIRQQSFFCNVCMQPLAAGATSSGNSSGSGSSIAMPIKFYQPTAEYGYQVEKVTSQDSITISTRNVTGFPTTKVTVSVSYVNGTAAADASVSASVIGEWYYWWGPNSSVVMYGQTDSNGKVVLELPVAPAVVSAWKWLPVNLPVSQKSEQVTVGGETVNVTAYWEPTYVGLASSALLLPPADSVQMTLHYQPVDYWATPAKGSVAPAEGAAVSSSAAGVPTQAQSGTGNSYYLPTSIPSAGNSALAGGTATSTPSTIWTPLMTTVVTISVLAVAAVVIGAVVFVRRRPTS